MMRLAIMLTTGALLASCATATPIRTGPQAESPYSVTPYRAASAPAAQGHPALQSTAPSAALFKRICLDANGDLLAAEREAIRSGLFAAPSITQFRTGGRSVAFLSRTPGGPTAVMQSNMLSGPDNCSVSQDGVQWNWRSGQVSTRRG